jgi:hypothetical protein
MGIVLLERLRRITSLNREDFFSWSSKEEISSFIPSFWPNIDKGISVGDDVEIMLDDEDAIAFFNQFIENVEEFLYIRKMQSCCWFVEDIERLSCRSFGEIKSQLDALRLSARKSRCRLSKSNIPKSYIDQHIEDTFDTRKM